MEKSSNKLEVYHNGVFFNDIPINNINRILGAMFSPFISQLKYMSKDGMKNLIINCIEMLQEFSNSQTMKKASRYSEYIIKKNDHNEIMIYIMNSYLSYEKLGVIKR